MLCLGRTARCSRRGAAAARAPTRARRVQVRGPAAVAEWRRLQEFMRPYAAAASVVPATAIRSDAAVLATTAARYGGALLASGGKAAALVKPFSELIEGVVKDPFIRNWLDLLCFLLSGLPAKGTIAAEVRPSPAAAPRARMQAAGMRGCALPDSASRLQMGGVNQRRGSHWARTGWLQVAFMFNEWYKRNSCLEFPRGGSQAMVDALARGVTKRGGRVHTRSHVEQVREQLPSRSRGTASHVLCMRRSLSSARTLTRTWLACNHASPERR